MNYELEGVLHKKYEAENKSASFQTREFVVLTEGNFPQYVKFQLTQDKCSVIDKYNEGDAVKVSFDLRGREWQGKYFTNLNAWRVEAGGQATSHQPPKGGSEPLPPPADAPDFNSGLPTDFDDLPF